VEKLLVTRDIYQRTTLEVAENFNDCHAEKLYDCHEEKPVHARQRVVVSARLQPCRIALYQDTNLVVPQVSGK